MIHSISYLKSANCTKLRRVYAFASLVARYVTRLRCWNAASFEFAITSFCRSENYRWEYEYKFSFLEYVTALLKKPTWNPHGTHVGTMWVSCRNIVGLTVNHVGTMWDQCEKLMRDPMWDPCGKHMGTMGVPHDQAKKIR